MKTKNWIIFIVFFLIFIILSIFTDSQKEKSESQVYQKLDEGNARVIIKFKTEIKNSDIADLKKGNKLIHVFKDSIAAEVSKDSIAELEKNENIEHIFLDRPVYAFLQESTPMINASSAWQIQLSGINITGVDETICILDTGINFSHPDLIGKNKTCIIDCVNKDCIKNCSIGDDHVSGHGTHVAGIAAASGGINGVAIGASLIGVKVLNSAGTGETTDVKAGIKWCINNSARYNISVISMSLGDCSNHSTYCNEDFLAGSVNEAVGKNISVVVAAGNGPPSCSGVINTNGPASPACIENATAIGAVNDNDEINFQRGPLFELLAPGININSTKSSGGYIEYEGTSMSTPHAAGAFALIRQFFRLQSGRILTPNEIKIILNNAGKRIDDLDGSGFNFSRIDIYSALISVDNSNPEVSLISPENNTSQFSQDLTIRCSANDVFLSNLTFYIWNSSGLYNNTELRQVNGANADAELNITLPYEDYEWNCLAYDKNGNFSFSASNFSLSIKGIEVNLISPENNLFTNQNQSFNCSAETTPGKNLTNITLYIWNSTKLIYNLTENLSGTNNSAVFQYNFTREGNFSWNCKAFNNYSDSAFSISNYSINYDATAPIINLINPADSASYTSNSQEIIFQYNVSDYSLSNCSLIINDIINDSGNGDFTKSFSPGTYSWQINCSDNAGNSANSSKRSFIITAVPFQIQSSSENSGGGSGSSIVQNKIYSVTTSSYNQELSKNDKITFNISKNKYNLYIKNVTNDSVNIDLNNLEIKLGTNEFIKMNLSSSEYYDLYILLNSIENKKANLTIQLIYEKMEKAQEIKENATIKMESSFSEENKKFNSSTILITIIEIIAILIILKLIFIIKNAVKTPKTKP